LGADDGSPSCHGNHRRPECRSLLFPANFADLRGANFAGLSSADLAGIPAADRADLPGAGLTGLPADASAGGRSVASHPPVADGYVHAADHAVGRSGGSDNTALRRDVDARPAASGSDRTYAAALLPVANGVRGRGGCFIAAGWMVVAGSVCAAGGKFVARLFFSARRCYVAGWGCRARFVPGVGAHCVARIACVAGLRAAERLELSGRVRQSRSDRVA
jgi:hypothetical protein